MEPNVFAFFTAEFEPGQLEHVQLEGIAEGNVIVHLQDPMDGVEACRARACGEEDDAHHGFESLVVVTATDAASVQACPVIQPALSGRSPKIAFHLDVDPPPISELDEHIEAHSAIGREVLRELRVEHGDPFDGGWWSKDGSE